MNILVAPLEALTDSRLSSSEMKVLLCLYSYKAQTDLVWPTIDQLSERSGINDKGRISKITSKLAKYGWVRKNRISWSGRIVYKLLKGIKEEEITTLEDFTTLAEAINTHEEENAIRKQVENISRKQAENARNNKQTNKQTNINNIQRTDFLGFEFKHWPNIPRLELLKDWKRYREKMRAPLSQTAVDRIGVEIHKALENGWASSVDECISESMARGWRGFKADWLRPKNEVGPNGGHVDHMRNNSFL